jgi:exopolyphosphatase/guanosine-5'-triphosphate,3'-diphosphate pyrophosphatase
MIVNSLSRPKGKKVKRCCIDLGSSYFRLLCLRPGEPPLQERSYIGWGAEVEGGGSISRETAARAAELLAGLLEQAGDTGAEEILVVATNALRSASNRGEVQRLIEDRAGLRIAVLSEKGEAFLGFEGASSLLEPGTPAVLVDPGGTSTEISWGTAPIPSGYISLPVGAHSENAMVWRLKDSLEGDSSLPVSGESHTIMFTGGTAVSLAVVWNRMRGKEYDGMEPVVLSPDQLDGILAALDSPGFESVLPPERVRLLPRGTAIVREVARALRAGRMTVTARDLRWGVVLGEGIEERGYLADEQEGPDSRRRGKH